MIKLIVGKKGSGKTKTLIDMVNAAVKASSGDVVCIEKGQILTYDISHEARLVDTDSYSIEGFDAYYGFVAGILATNYDITDLFADSVLKICGRDYGKLGGLFEKLETAIGDANINVVFTVSADSSELPESVTKYL